MAAQPRTKLISHVSPRGQEIVEILVHCAFSIPLTDGSTPRAYVTGQSKYTLSTQQIGEKPNATLPIPGVNPVWNELLFVYTLDDSVPAEELIILLIDENRQSNRAEFRIPWNWLIPFHQYHLELVMQSLFNFKLYVSVTRKQNIFSPINYKYYGLELLLKNFETPITQRQSIYAVARIIGNYRNYRTNLLQQGLATLTFISVIFPNPNPNLFQKRVFGSEGYPQVTLSCIDSTTITWNHPFFFSSNEEKDAMFSNGDAAIVIEFYPFSKVNERAWQIDNLLGWCRIKLDQRSRESLERDTNGIGLRTDRMLVETFGNLLVPKVSSYLTAEVLIRLIAKKREKVLNVSSSYAILPSFYSDETNRLGFDPVYLQPPEQTVKPKPIYSPVPRPKPVVHSPVIRKAPEPIEYPSGDFQQNYLNNKPKEILKPKIDPDKLLLYTRDDFSDVPADYRYAFLNYKQPTSVDADGWLLYYQNLLSAYRALARKMNEDLNLYKNQIRNLELSNVQLTTKMTNFENKKQVLLKLAEISESDKTNLNKSFLELKTRLSIKTNENLVLKDQIARLAREIERKKEVEIELNKMISLQNSQNSELAKMQNRLTKAYGVEETCKRQEIVIEKLETLIKKLMLERKNGSADSYYDRIKNEVNDIRIGKDFEEKYLKGNQKNGSIWDDDLEI